MGKRRRQPPVRIVVDVHERPSGIADVLAEELGAEVELAPLPAGDYACGADTLVERKRVLDLHGAVTRGRLWPQLAKLRAAAAFPYLLVEGTDLDRGPLGGAAIRASASRRSTRASPCSAAASRATPRSGSTGSRCAASASSPQPTGRRTRSDPRRRARKRPKRCSRPFRDSRPPRPGRCSRTSGAWPPSSPPRPRTGSRCPASVRSEALATTLHRRFGG